MGHFTLHFPSLLLIVLFISPQIQARNIKFLLEAKSPFPGPGFNQISNVPTPSVNGFAQPPGINEISYAPSPLESEVAPGSESSFPAPKSSEAQSPWSEISDFMDVEAPFSPGHGINAPEPVESDNAYGLYGSEFNDQDDIPTVSLKELDPVESYNRENYNENGFVGQEGMSDTRFLDNGKYYYDESARKSDNNGVYYNGEKSNYEFDSMDEYEKQQGYP